MVIVVIILNLVLASACLYLAWWLWKLRRILSKVTQTLIAADRTTHRILYGSPTTILKGQRGVDQLQQQYQKLAVQLRMLQQVLSLVGLGQFVWQTYRRRLRGKGRWRASSSSLRRVKPQPTNFL